MRKILTEHRQETAGIILLLAWKLGLRREEMHRLMWRDFDFAKQELCLPGRQTPVEEETCEILWERFLACRRQSEFVVISDRFRTQMQPSSISRAARQVLAAEGQEGIGLEDLRQDCIIRWLETWGVSTTARFSGVAVDTLYANYSSCISGEPPQLRQAAEIDEFAVWPVMQSEGASPVGLALWLIWQLGLSMTEALELTWEQVDLQNRRLWTGNRSMPFGTALERLLREERERRRPDADPHVLLSPNAQRPYNASRISRLIKTALLRGGVEGVTPEALSRRRRQKSGDVQLLLQAEKMGYITKSEVMSLLSATSAQAYERLRRLTGRGELVKIGARYYPAGTVVPPEEHRRKICEYLAETGGAYRQELADILHLEVRQCSRILQKLTEDGHLVREGQRYLLSQENFSKNDQIIP